MKKLLSVFVLILLICSAMFIPAAAEPNDLLTFPSKYNDELLYNGVKYKQAFGRSTLSGKVDAVNNISAGELHYMFSPDSASVETTEKAFIIVTFNVGYPGNDVYVSSGYVRADLYDEYLAIQHGEKGVFYFNEEEPVYISIDDLKGEKTELESSRVPLLKSVTVCVRSENSMFCGDCGLFLFDSDNQSCYYLNFHENGLHKDLENLSEKAKVTVHKVTSETVLEANNHLLEEDEEEKKPEPKDILQIVAISLLVVSAALIVLLKILLK